MPSSSCCAVDRSSRRRLTSDWASAASSAAWAFPAPAAVPAPRAAAAVAAAAVAAPESHPAPQAPSSARLASARPGLGQARAGQHVRGGPAGRAEVAVPGLGQRPPGPGPGLQPGQVARGELPVGVPQRVPGGLDLPAAQPGHAQRVPEQAHRPVLGLGGGGGLGPLGQGAGPGQQGRIGIGPAAGQHDPQRGQGGLHDPLHGRDRAAERPVAAVEVGARPVPVAVPQPGGGPRRGDRRVVGGAVRGEQGQHALQVGGGSGTGHPGPGLGQGLRGVVPVLRLGRAADRGDRLVVRGVPAGRPAEQHRDLVRDLPVQLGGEDLAEQRMVGVLAVLAVDRVHEAVLPAEAVQRADAAGLAGQRVGQVTGHLLGEAGPEQEHARGRGLLDQDLVPQVVGDDRLVAGQVGDGHARFRVGPAGHRGQPQAGHPALGPAQQRVPGPGVHVQAHHGEVGVCFLAGAGQVVAADVGQLAGDAQPGQLQRGRLPGGQDQPQGGGRVPDQQVDPAEHGRVGQLVDVVQHQDDRLGEGLGRFDEPQREPVR